MKTVILFIFPTVLFCIFLVVTGYFENSEKRRQKKMARNYSSFGGRRQKAIDEANSRKAEKERYQDSIEAAFKKAGRFCALLVSEVPYRDIVRDRFRNSGRHPGDLPKPLLTRITPILTMELAEEVREYEILELLDLSSTEDFRLRERLAALCLKARNILWLVVEVPEKYAPPKLKDEDRISYPEINPEFEVPKEILEAARKMLNYDREYVKMQADFRLAKSESFEVTEE
jgi:hypothetical protein